MALGLLGCSGLPNWAFAGQWSGFVAAGSDNVYRGLTQSRGEASFSADLHWRSAADWYAGMAIATVNLNPGPGAPLELTSYLGRNFSVSPAWSARATLLHYEYPQESQALHYAYDEVVMSLRYSDRAALNVGYSPDTSRFSFRAIAIHRPAYSAEMVWSQPLARSWRANIGLGRYVMARPIGSAYNYGQVGVDFSHAQWQISGSVIGADANAKRLFGDFVSRVRGVVTIIWRFAGSP